LLQHLLRYIAANAAENRCGVGKAIRRVRKCYKLRLVEVASITNYAELGDYLLSSARDYAGKKGLIKISFL
jgi:hypothetical protein